MNVRLKKYASGFVIALLTGIIVPIWWSFARATANGSKTEKASMIWLFLIGAAISIVVYSIWYFISIKNVDKESKPIHFMIPCLIVAAAALVISLLVPLLLGFSSRTINGVMMYTIIDLVLVIGGIVGATLVSKP